MLSLLSKIFGLAGMITCLGLVYYFEGESHATGVWRLFHWPAMVLTGIGPMATVVMVYGFGPCFRTLFLGMFASPARLQKKKYNEALYLHQLGKSYYENGPSAFETAKTKGLSPLVKSIIDRLAVRMPTPDIAAMAHISKGKRESDLSVPYEVASAGTRLCPSIGMLGTIMGMVRLLATLKDPSGIGEHMSLALLTTFYGLFFSVILWTPVQQKLDRLINAEMETAEQALRWLDLIEKKKPANYFADTEEIGGKKKKRAA